MRFETVILLIIAFNVVTAILQRRAKKAQKEAQREAQKARGEASGQSAETDLDEAYEEYPEYQEYQEEAVFEEDLRSRQRRERSSRDSDDARSSRHAPPQREPDEMKMPSMGRDILDQLARDFGLKVPRKPKPVPTSPAPRPSAKGKTALERAPASQRTTSTHSPTRSPQLIAPAAARPPQLASEPARTRDSAPSITVNLQGVDRLREAIVLKEILDAPVSRRRFGSQGR